MQLRFDDVDLCVRVDGPSDGPPVVFANSLGTDLRLWDAVVPVLPQGLRLIRWDKRGHGGSSVPPPPYGMGTLVRDAERICDELGVRDAVIVGLSIGGMIAQALAVKRPDLVHAVVLSNTAVKLGTPQMWHDRIADIAAHGLPHIADAVMARWFGRAFAAGPGLPLWRARFLETPAAGYIGCCHAIAGTDLLTPTSGLRLPALCIAGDQDAASPPDMVRELADLIPGSRFEIMRGAGHLPCVEQPEAYARLLTDFLTSQGHI
jgi:3-oxoadipate enol-lactonase